MKIRPITMAFITVMAREAAPKEMCGLLIKSALTDYVAMALVRNDAEADNEYLVNADDHLRIMLDCETSGCEIVGVVHSHVRGPYPSGMDVATMAPGYLYAIYSIEMDEMLVWKLEDGEVVSVSYSVD